MAQSTTSAAKTLAVLECIGLAGTRSLAEIAAEMRLPKSTLLRLIGILVSKGFVRRTAHGEYALGLKMWRIGCNAVNSETVRDEVIPILRDLVERTGETAHYAVYEDGHSVYVEKVDGLHPIRSYTAVGGRSPRTQPRPERRSSPGATRPRLRPLRSAVNAGPHRRSSE